MKPAKLFGVKLLREDLKSLNGEFQYSYAKGRDAKWLEVPGNGSYVAFSGGLDAGGLGPIAVAVECDLESEVFPNCPLPESVRCFGRVKVRNLRSCAKRLNSRLLADARMLSREMLADPEDACVYALNVLKGRFPAGEAAIAKKAEWSCLYALHVLRGRFPEGEAAIAKDAHWSHWYGKDILKRT